MSDKFIEWFREQAKEANLHRTLGLAEGYLKAVYDIRRELFSKPITLAAADAALMSMEREVKKLQKEALEQSGHERKER